MVLDSVKVSLTQKAVKLRDRYKSRGKPEVGEKAYWKGEPFTNREEYQDDLGNYLRFLSSPKAKRNMEIVERLETEPGSQIARELDGDVKPNYISVLAHGYVGRDILDRQRNMTPATRDVVSAFKTYENLYRSENPEKHGFRELLKASRLRSSRELYSQYDEGESFTCIEAASKLDSERTTFYQDALPPMKEVDLIQWEEESTNGEVTPQHPYKLVKEFLGSLEAIMDNHKQEH